MKKILTVAVCVAILAMMSCSDSKSQAPKEKQAEAVFNSMVMEPMVEVLSSDAMGLMFDYSGMMDTLPFGSPVKGVSGFTKDSGVREILSGVRNSSGIFRNRSISKQSDRFIFEDNLGTYTWNGYDWDVVPGGESINIIVPADLAYDGKEFKLIISDYEDKHMEWSDDYDTGYSDYFVIKFIFDMYHDNIIVLGVDFEADWKHSSLIDDVIPSYLSLTMTMPPFLFTASYQTEGLTESVSLTATKNGAPMMSIDLNITYTDSTFEDIADVYASYSAGVHLLEMFMDSMFMDAVDDDDDEIIADMINEGDHVYLNIKERRSGIYTIIGRLKASVDEEGLSVYILFNDGSIVVFDDMFDDDWAK